MSELLVVRTTRFYFTQGAEKAAWGDGPWNGEPDKVQWTDETTGLPCLAVRGPMGVWCGYAGVEEGHPLFGLKYDEVPGELDRVHGGLTFSDSCMDGDEGEVVCHIPDAGQSDHVWWFGFDCGHYLDLVPRMLMLDREISPTLALGVEHYEYRTLSYVRREVCDLAVALQAAA